MGALVTGATGFVGQRLVEELRKGDSERPIHLLVRRPEHARQRFAALDVRCFEWDAQQGAPNAEAFDGIDVVYHLAGENIVGRRWTDLIKNRLVSSRVDGTRSLVEGMMQAARPPSVLVSASAVGYYGDTADEACDEDTPAAAGFLPELCAQWEEEACRAETAGVRVVRVRIGLVLGPDGGALQSMLLPFKLGLGGTLGNGRQWMSWIHVVDLVRMLRFCAEQEVSGAVNGVGPSPVRNREFTKTLASVLSRPAFFAIPKFALRLAMGEVAPHLVESMRIVPKVAQRSGFKYEHGDLEAALREILGR